MSEHSESSTSALGDATRIHAESRSQACSRYRALAWTLLSIGLSACNQDAVQSGPDAVDAAMSDSQPSFPGSCYDNIKNNTETDTDCGGLCPACGPGRACLADSDCSGGVCRRARCTTPSGFGVAPASVAETPYQINYFITADVNKDAILDVLGTGGSLVALLGTGGGTFVAQPDIPTGAQPGELTWHDYNGDGIPDVVLALNPGTNQLHFLAGLDGARFGAGQALQRVGLAFGLASADLDNDTFDDLIMSDAQNNNLLIFRGLGSPKLFETAITIPTHAYPNELAVGDVDGDGHLDIAVATTGGIDVLRQVPSLGLTFETRTVRAQSGSPAEGVALGDVTGDGATDLVFVTADGDVVIAVGAGNGTFTPLASHPSGHPRYSPALADLNGDSLVDIAVADKSGYLRVWLSQKGGMPRPEPPIAVDGKPSCLRLADVDADGRPDVLLSDSSKSRFFVFVNTTR